MSLVDKCSARQIELFWQKIDQHGPVVSADLGPCWIWTGAPMAVGYGLLTVGSVTNGTRTRVLAHRLAWELANGPIPVGDGYHGTCIMHKCDVRLCVNPSHLLAGTQRENLRDMTDKGRGKTPGLKMTAHPRAKLSEADVLHIRTCTTPGRELARRYGVSRTAIYLVRKGTNWRQP